VIDDLMKVLFCHPPGKQFLIKKIPGGLCPGACGAF